MGEKPSFEAMHQAQHFLQLKGLGQKARKDAGYGFGLVQTPPGSGGQEQKAVLPARGIERLDHRASLHASQHPIDQSDPAALLGQHPQSGGSLADPCA